jgi:hypothetical protein
VTWRSAILFHPPPVVCCEIRYLLGREGAFGCNRPSPFKPSI